MATDTEDQFARFRAIYPSRPADPWEPPHWDAAREAWRSEIADGSDPIAIVNGAAKYADWCDGKSITRIFAPRNWLLRRDWRKPQRGGETATARATELLTEPAHVVAYRALGDIASIIAEPIATDRAAAEAQLRRWPSGHAIDAARQAIDAVRQMDHSPPAEIASILHAALDHLPSSARRAAMVRHVVEIERLPAPMAVQAMRRLMRKQRAAPTIADLAGALSWSFDAMNVMEDQVQRLACRIDEAIDRFTKDTEWTALTIDLGYAVHDHDLV